MPCLGAAPGETDATIGEHILNTPFHRFVPLVPLLSLVVLILIWAHFGARRSNTESFPIFALFALPLLIPLHGMWREHAKSFVIAALIALCYLLHALVTLASSPGEQLFGWLETLLSLFLLISASLHARWLARRAL